jgi:hypothetical protein
LRIHYSAGRWWLTPVILATQEAVIRRISVPRQLRFERPFLENIQRKIELVEWFKW